MGATNRDVLLTATIQYNLRNMWYKVEVSTTACLICLIKLYQSKSLDLMLTRRRTYLFILKNVPNLCMKKIKRAIQKFKEWNWKQTFLFQVWARIRITIFKASRYWDKMEWNNFWRSILFIFMFLMYSDSAKWPSN